MSLKSVLIKDSNKPRNFWKHQESLNSLLENKFEKQCKISARGILSKYSKKTQKIQDYTFFLPNSQEVCFVDLTTCVLDEPKTGSSSSPSGFSLKRHGKTKDFFANDQSKVDKWLQRLRRFCIQTNFFASYEIGEKLGKGNFATVMRAKSKKTDEVFAVKTIEMETLSKSYQHRQAIRAEIAIHRTLHHPSVLRFYEVFEDEHMIYLIFELLEGGELFERVLKKKRYTERESAIVIKQIFESLVYLERKGVVHRDIKLENVLLANREDDCLVKLADFGLSTTVERIDPKMRCGTPGYVAPEIIAGKMYDCKSDIFSTGAILYVLLSGCTPFPGKTFDEIMARNRKCNPKFNTSYWSNISFEAIDFVIKLMSSDPSKRPTASEALESSWLKSIFLEPIPSRYNLKESLSAEDKQTVMEEDDYKIKVNEHKKVRTRVVDFIEDKLKSDPVTDEYPIKENNSPLLLKKTSFNLKEEKSPNRTFSKQHSLLHSERNESATSMHKIVMHRNLFKKMKTIDPPILDEASDSNEFSMHQSVRSKFDVKSGMANSFYAKGASQGMSSEDEISSPKKVSVKEPVDSQDNLLKRSGFSRMLSIKSSGLAPSPTKISRDYEWQIDEDGVPDEGNKILVLIEGLQNLCFTTKPAFQYYDTGDSEKCGSHISVFPVFKNAFKNANQKSRPTLK